TAVIPPNPPPEWLLKTLEFIGKLLKPLGQLLGRGWSVIELLLLAGAVIGIAWIAWTLLWPLWRDRAQRLRIPAPEWAPTREAALALLEDADRLAAEGRFGEAAHLLLQRSVHQIASARPDWLSPSSTAREIATLRALPAAARTAFAVIAREVERSLFALQGLSAEDWTRARDAYADFALQRLGTTA
ncbi:hypothetical protein, partial [Novosphingobium sp.]|uniref:hypothetical protein n=1 Tax=Novosphingobium sp. TaxID=1874826 RepID=UPI0038BB5BCF